MRWEVAYAFRQLARNPRFAATIIVPIAVALGLGTAVATITDAILIKGLPYPDAARLVRIDGVFTRLPLRVTESGLELTAPLSAPEISAARSFSVVAMYTVAGLDAGDDRPERLRAAAVTSGFFDALQISPRLGHVFTDRDIMGRRRDVVISAHLWRARFQADPAILGRVLDLNGQRFVVVAVMPDEFDFPDRTDLWIAAGADPQVAMDIAVPSFVARLKTGATAATARAELLQILSHGALTRQDAARTSLRVTRLRDALVAPLRPTLWFVTCAGLLLLLVACLNASNLMAANVYDRQRDFAVRRAIGATTGGVLQPILFESLLLVLVATVCAVPLAAAALDAIRRLLPPAVLPSSATELTNRSLLILTLVSGLAASVFGLAPLFAAVSNSSAPLHAASTATPPRRRAGGVVVVAQVASALVILGCAMTILDTVRRLQAVDLGAHHDSAVIAEITLPAAQYEDSTRHRSFFERLRNELRSVPGVTDAGVTTDLPGTDMIIPSIPLQRDGMPPPRDATMALRLAATPGYFSALGIDLIAGRPLSDADTPSSRAVVVVSLACARALGLSPAEVLGRRIMVGIDGTRWATVVGVVRDVRMRGPERETFAAVYVPFAQTAVGPTAFVVIDGTATREILVDGLRSAVARIDPNLPAYNLRAFGDVREDYLATRRFAMTTATIFGATVFAVACFGLNAIVTYMVRRRTREIGVRLAIGASPFLVRRDVVGAGARYAAVGVVIGLIVLPFILNVLVATIPGIVRLPTVRLAMLAAAVFALATSAAWLPARRAARIDPMVALRSE